MSKCKTCEHDAVGGDLCRACAARLGLVPGGGVRRSAPCAKCNHPKLIRALARELTDQTTPSTSINAERGANRVVPMGVTYEPVVERTFWRDTAIGSGGADREAARGTLDMYVCTRCGFTEWYCRDPQSIPIGDEYGTELLDVTGETPYR